MTDHRHIEIIGAGVAGLCAATELVAHGLRPRLIDRAGRPGAHHCSWWAGGMLAPDCEGETAEEPVVRLGRHAAEWWRKAGIAVADRGSLVIAPGRDVGEIDRFARRTRNHRSLDAEAIGTIEPALEGRFRRGLFFEAESHLEPRAALSILVGRLEEAGVAIQCTEAPAAPEAGVLRIDCRGLSARGELPNLRGVKGEMAVLRSADIELSRPIRLLHPRQPLYIVPRGDGRFMLGATQIESAEKGRVSVRSIMELLSSAYALHPAFGEAELVEIGTDVRPAFPDNVPRLVRRGSTIHLNGLFRHGFLMAPILARHLAEWIVHDRQTELFNADQGQW